MVIEFYPYPMFIGIFILALLLFTLKDRKHSQVYLLCFSLFFAYLMVVLWVIFFPIRLPQDWPRNVTVQAALWSLAHVNLNPFNYGDLFSMNANIIFWQIGGNILLTLPFGFGLPFLVPIPMRRILWLALFAGIILETTQLLIELLGMVSSYGHSIDINDVLLNATGVLIGYCIFRVVTGCASYNGMILSKKRKFY